MLLTSLRKKLVSALELMRVYQHKLQTLESLQSLPIAQGMQPQQKCSTCTAQPPSAPLQPGSTTSRSDELSSACLHQACRRCQELDTGNILLHEHSLLEHSWTSKHSPHSRLEVRFDPSIGHAGAFLTASQPHHGRAQSQHACTKSQSPSTGVSAPSASANCQRCSGRTSTVSTEQYKLAKDPIQSPGEGVSDAEDTWAFMDAAAGECPLHAVRCFDGDLLSLVTDVEDMMSCSGLSAVTNQKEQSAQ